jgi:hypothetical protein
MCVAQDAPIEVQQLSRVEQWLVKNSMSTCYNHTYLHSIVRRRHRVCWAQVLHTAATTTANI